MLKIYHNPRCKTSRAGLEVLKASGKEFEIVEYLKMPLTANEIRSLIRKTGLQAKDVVRTQEAYYKENLKGKNLTEEQWIEAITIEPKLLQRPIVETDHKAVIAKPVENIHSLWI